MNGSASRAEQAVKRTALIRIALAIAKNTNWLVFPCLETKAPATAHGFKDASRDPDVIQRMFAQPRAALIGVPTGAVSGFDVLDIDVKDGSLGPKWLQAAETKLPPTRRYATRSGGCHLLFRHHPRAKQSAGAITRGIDTRANGGFIVFWFAHGFECLDHAPITDWPDWLLDVLNRKQTSPPSPIPTKPREPREPMKNPSGLASHLLARVASASQGNRHKTLRDIGLTIGGLLTELEWSHDTAAFHLERAIQFAGGDQVDPRNYRPTIQWALTNGAAKPLNLRDRS